MRLLVLVALALFAASCYDAADPTPTPTAAPTIAPAVQPSPGPPPPAPLPPEGVLYARPGGSRGQLIAYRQGTGEVSHALPEGLLSADGNRFTAAEQGSKGTIVRSFDPRTGETLGRVVVDGLWRLVALSPSGRFAALGRVPLAAEEAAWRSEGRWETDLRTVDTLAGSAARPFRLAGNYEVEAIAADGRALFLVEHLPSLNPTHYQIRLFDLTAGQLTPSPLVDKGTEAVMAGQPWEGLPSSDGHWLLTPYLDTARGTAFIHALNLDDRFPACIDLPGGASTLDQVRAYALLLASDNRTLFAINPTIGLITIIDLSQYGVVTTIHFPPATARRPPGYARAIHSAVGETIYFTDGRGIWGYDVGQKHVSDPIAKLHSDIVGPGVSADGTRVYAATTTGAVSAFDVRSAQPAALEP